MPTLGRKHPVLSKRRVDEEGEEDGDLLQDDASQSDISGTDDELDNLSRVGSYSPVLARAQPDSKTNVESSERESAIETDAIQVIDKISDHAPHVNGDSNGNGNGNDTNTDTLLMTTKSMSAMALDADHEIEEVEFINTQLPIKAPVVVQSSMIDSIDAKQRTQETHLDRKRRDHEEYERRKAADPAFTPNRGAFFMHDHRQPGPGANGYRPFGVRGGNVRARGGFSGTQNQMSFLHNDPINQRWTHNKHDEVREPQVGTPQSQQPPVQTRPQIPSVSQAANGPSINRALSAMKPIGKIAVRILLPGFESAMRGSSVEIRQYTRLPDHRPPLRRDKPVRISLPNLPPRFIYPTQDRSFIFIPRAQRPNQQGFGSHNNRGRSGYGSFSAYSRRTSVFGGSMYGNSYYTPSMGLSRRSSMAYDIHRDIISPSTSIMNGFLVNVDGPRAVVRLPPVMQPPASIIGTNGVVSEDLNLPDDAQNSMITASLSSSAVKENRQNSIPIHQPRPQHSVSLADIESPATMSYSPPQQNQEAFHQQVPASINGTSYAHDAYTPSQSINVAFGGQVAVGTPLSGIPERAIHAPAFQPVYPPQSAYYQQSMPMVQPQQGYYYTPHYGQDMSGQAAMFHPAQAPIVQPDTTASNNFVTQEVNGMVYYFNPADIPAITQSTPPYPFSQAHYPQFANMGAMITPSPDGLYMPQPPHGIVYYQ